MNYKCTYKELANVNDILKKKNPKNNNKHSKEQIERLAEIIAYQGQRSPIVISNQSGLIVKGHARLEAIKKLKWEKAAVDYQDYDTQEQEYADMTADNAIALWAELDFSMVNLELENLGPDFDINMLGIEDFKIDPSEIEPQCDEDEVPEETETRCKPGDIWLLGRHRLMCGDSTSIDAVEKLMNGEKAEMLFTDPPYGYKYKSNHQKKHDMLMNDDVILDFFPCAFAGTADNAGIYVCGSHQTIHVWRSLIEEHFTYKNLIVWKKNNWSMGDLSGDFAGQHELIIFAHKGRIDLNGGRSTNVWEFDRDPPKDHPTQKPVPLIEFAINKTTKQNATVLDLFGGSGSTLIASEKTNRNCYMMELDPKYCDVILSRWEKFTGKKAVLNV